MKTCSCGSLLVCDASIAAGRCATCTDRAGRKLSGSYDEIRATNWSTLKAMRTSPKHYLAATQAARPDTDTFRVGRAVHTCVLEPDRFPLQYVVFTFDKSKGEGAKKRWEAFQELHQDKTILTVAQYDQACRIRDAVRSHPLVQPLLANGKPEQVLQWTDEQTGIKLKGRADLVLPNVVVDLKTSRHAVNMRSFIGQAYGFGYYHQTAFYSRALDRDRTDCVLVAVEPTQPHDVAVYKLDANSVWACNRDIDKLLARLADCLAADKWPGVFDAVQTIEEPGYVFKNAADEEGEEEAA